MLDLDIEQFWKDDITAHEENCFSKNAKQVALGIRMSDECVFAELGVDGNPWSSLPFEQRVELNKRYNEKAIKIVGRPLLHVPQSKAPEDSVFPAYKNIGEVFDGYYQFYGSWWLRPKMKTEEDLIKALDKIDNMDFRSFILPSNWDTEVKRIYEKYGYRPSQYMHVRGPVTLASSVFGAENLIFLINDNPDLAKRFSNAIAKVILKYVKIFITESGHTTENFIHGFSFADDDSNLLTPEMYELFGYPILKKVFDFTSPYPTDTRYQHSDSAMGHLVPILAKLNFNGCNFGPTVMIDHIRKYMKNARIDGQLEPLVFMRNDEKEIIRQVRRDCGMARENDARGVNINTAGSINNGSLLTSMRLVMAVIQNYGRY